MAAGELKMSKLATAASFYLLFPLKDYTLCAEHYNFFSSLPLAAFSGTSG
jgi:hypothetical protein